MLIFLWTFHNHFHPYYPPWWEALEWTWSSGWVHAWWQSEVSPWFTHTDWFCSFVSSLTHLRLVFTVSLPSLKKHLSMTCFRGAVTFILHLETRWQIPIEMEYQFATPPTAGITLSLLLPWHGEFPKQAVSSSEYKFMEGGGGGYG